VSVATAPTEPAGELTDGLASETPLPFESATAVGAAEAEVSTVAALRTDVGLVDLLAPVGGEVLADLDGARLEFAESHLPAAATELGIDLSAGDAGAGALRRAPDDGWTGSLLGQASTTTTMSLAMMTTLVERADVHDSGRVDRRETYHKQPAPATRSRSTSAAR
jgi:hypothetical protein